MCAAAATLRGGGMGEHDWCARAHSLRCDGSVAVDEASHASNDAIGTIKRLPTRSAGMVPEWIAA